MLRWVVPILAVAAVLVGALLWSQRETGPLEVSGFLEADQIRVGSRVGGRILAVHVAEGDSVEEGQLLVELEPFDLDARKAEADAHLAKARAELERLERGFRAEEIDQAAARVDRLAARLEEARTGPRPQEIAVAQAELKRAEAMLALAGAQMKRSEKLFRTGATTADQVDRVREEREAALANVDARREALALLEEGTRREVIKQAEAELAEAHALLALRRRGYRKEEIAQARAAVAAAEAAVAALGARIAELKVVAPLAGTVEAIQLRRGDLVSPNAPVLSLLDPGRLWVRAYVPENRLSFGVGDRVQVYVDAHPGRPFAGEVVFVSREAEFVPGNVQTPEERVKQVFRVKIDLREGLDLLHPGLPADVRFPE